MLLGCAAVPEKPQPLLPISLPSLKEQTLALHSGEERRIRLSWGGLYIYIFFLVEKLNFTRI